MDIFRNTHPGFHNDLSGNPGSYSPYGVSASAPFHALTEAHRARNSID